MVEQQTPNPANINLRSKGLKIGSGKLHRGCVKDATSKLSIGSIPATYESIIYRSQSKKAFGTSAKRFYKSDEAERMFSSEKGTGQASRLRSSQNFRDSSEQLATRDNSYGLVQESREGLRKDFNRQGHGAFISKVKREWVKSSKAPGPTHYHLNKGKKQTEKEDDDERKCKTRLLRYRKYAAATAQNKCRQKNTCDQPGPGYYLFDRKEMWEKSLKGWKSSFQTKVSRDGYVPESISPGPGFYLNEEKQEPQQVIRKKENKQKNKENSQKNTIFDQIDEKPKEANYQPGPGEYNHQLPNFKPLYQKIKMSKNFMSPIFNGKRRLKQSPGPTLYQVRRMYDDVKPKLIESMAFMSETKRQAFQPSEIYGPNLVPPELPGPKNFHFNINDDWL